VDTLPNEQEAMNFRNTLEIVADSPVDEWMGVFLRFVIRRSTRTSIVNVFHVIAGLDGDILRQNLERHGLLYVHRSVASTAGGSTPGTTGGSTGTLTTVPTTDSSGENKDEENALMQLSVVEGTLPTLPEREANLFRGRHLADLAADSQMTSVSIFLPSLNDKAHMRAEEAFCLIIKLGGHILSPNLQHHALGNGANTSGAGQSMVGTVSTTGIAGGNTSMLITVPLVSSTSEVAQSNDVQLVANSSFTDPSFHLTFNGPAQQADGQSGGGSIV